MQGVLLGPSELGAVIDPIQKLAGCFEWDARSSECFEDLQSI